MHCNVIFELFFELFFDIDRLPQQQLNNTKQEISQEAEKWRVTADLVLLLKKIEKRAIEKKNAIEYLFIIINTSEVRPSP